MSRFTRRLLLPLLLAGSLLQGPGARGHGADGGESWPAPGEFRARGVLTLEGHAGLENNFEGQPRHYAIDGTVGTVLEWGLGGGGVLGLDLDIGPALVWGEAEHFYGRVEVEDEDEEGGHHGGPGSNWRRSDIKGRVQVRYQPNRRLQLSAQWLPHYITATQVEDVAGLRNELVFSGTLALGPGDVNFALGDGLETIVDGLYLSADHHEGWESTGTYLGSYTDTRLGVGFQLDLVNVTLEAGPRFYRPGSYAGLDQRIDWGGELELTLPIRRGLVWFAHWEPVYSSQVNSSGWVNHIGTGLTLRF